MYEQTEVEPLVRWWQADGKWNDCGSYAIQINDDYLVSDGPTGQSEYEWNAVDNVELSEN